MPKVKKIPTRMCVACKQMRPKRDLIRVVRTPAGEVQVDLTGKLSGRGAYVCPTPPCAEAGVRDGGLEHALEVPIPADMAVDLHRAVQTRQAALSVGGPPKIIRIPAGARPPLSVRTAEKEQ